MRRSPAGQRDVSAMYGTNLLWKVSVLPWACYARVDAHVGTEPRAGHCVGEASASSSKIHMITRATFALKNVLCRLIFRRRTKRKEKEKAGFQNSLGTHAGHFLPLNFSATLVDSMSHEANAPAMPSLAPPPQRNTESSQDLRQGNEVKTDQQKPVISEHKRSSRNLLR